VLTLLGWRGRGDSLRNAGVDDLEHPPVSVGRQNKIVATQTVTSEVRRSVRVLARQSRSRPKKSGW